MPLPPPPQEPPHLPQRWQSGASDWNGWLLLSFRGAQSFPPWWQQPPGLSKQVASAPGAAPAQRQHPAGSNSSWSPMHYPHLLPTTWDNPGTGWLAPGAVQKGGRRVADCAVKKKRKIWGFCNNLLNTSAMHCTWCPNHKPKKLTGY
uniref:Uncharacterized protein n=1 Tax=Crocodylus porosus TaxID=8502 RepID=A0A7M4F3L1_CROPO